MNQTNIEFNKLQIPENEIDIEWANDWKNITQIFELTDKLEKLFNDLDVGYLRKLTQDSIILNLRKYIWSLKGFIIEKYGEQKLDYFEEFLNL